jgi:hypothetical protein
LPSRLALLAVLLVACTGDVEDPIPVVTPDAPPLPDASGCPPDSFLAYDNFGGPFMRQYCTGCHSTALTGAMRKDAPVGVDFDTLEQVRADTDRIYDLAAESDAMPPGGGPHPDDRTLLAEWLLCGAPE